MRPRSFYSRSHAIIVEALHDGGSQMPSHERPPRTRLEQLIREREQTYAEIVRDFHDGSAAIRP